MDNKAHDMGLLHGASISLARLGANWGELARIAVCILLFGSGSVNLIGGLSSPGYDFAIRSEVDAVAVNLRKIPAAARLLPSRPTIMPFCSMAGKWWLVSGTLVDAGFSDYAKVNDQRTLLMNGAPNWREIAHNLKARYLFWGREERLNYGTSTHRWEQEMTPVVSGNWGAIYDL